MAPVSSEVGWKRVMKSGASGSIAHRYTSARMRSGQRSAAPVITAPPSECPTRMGGSPLASMASRMRSM